MNKNIKKKLLSSVLCLLLLLTMFLGSTIAYFTDTASTSNVMVVGKVDIEQSADFGDLVLMPTVTLSTPVTVKNTGSQPSYVRTLIAFEDAPVDGTTNSLVDYLELNGNITFPKVNGEKVQFVKDSVTYTVGCYIYNGPLVAGGDYTCLNSITLKETAPSAWEVATVDGKYSVLVLSQAVQATGLTLADLDNASVFGQITSANTATWFGGTVISGN